MAETEPKKKAKGKRALPQPEIISDEYAEELMKSRQGSWKIKKHKSFGGMACMTMSCSIIKVE
jgi:hypothetical protein